MYRTLRTVGAAALALSAALTACSAGGGDAMDHVSLTDCSGQPAYTQARLRVTNDGSGMADYEVVVAFVDERDGEQLTTAVELVRALAAGQSKRLSVSSSRLYAGDFRVDCQVVDVTRVSR